MRLPVLPDRLLAEEARVGRLVGLLLTLLDTAVSVFLDLSFWMWVERPDDAPSADVASR